RAGEAEAPEDAGHAASLGDGGAATETASELAAAIERLLSPGPSPPGDDDERREAAETLHGLGTARALVEIDKRPGPATARALLRDTRWDVPGAGAVPLLGAPGGLAALRVLAGMRLRRAARLAASRWASASAGGAVAGAVAGLAGGIVLLFCPG